MSDQIRFTLRDGADLAGVDLKELWWRYAAIGGSGDLLSLAQRLNGVIPCGRHEHDRIAQALNEAFIDQGINTMPVAYFDRLPPRIPLPAQSTPAGAHGWPAQPRRDAAAARLRSAAAARRAAALHATAAQLMQASGQLQFAQHAFARARVAQQRGAAGAVA